MPMGLQWVAATRRVAVGGRSAPTIARRSRRWCVPRLRPAGSQLPQHRGSHAALLVALVALVVGAGCSDAGAPAAAPGRAPLRVFATTRALADLVSRVGGRSVEVTWAAEGGRPLPEPGRDVADDLRRASASADLVVGGGGAAWATAGFDDDFRGRRVIRADLLPGGGNGAGSGAPPGASPWLDPRFARVVAAEVARRLSVLRPADAERFSSNLAALSADLDRLAAEVAAVGDDLSPGGGDLSPGGGDGPAVVVFSGDFDALLLAAGVRPVAFDGVPTDLSPADADRLRGAARDAGASSVAVPADLTPAALDDLERRTGLRPIPLDALGTPTAGRAGYADVVRFDLQQLRAALGG